MKPINLLEYVLTRLSREGLSLAEIHRATQLGETWLSQLRSGRIPNPTVTKVQRLADYFASMESGDQKEAA